MNGPTHHPLAAVVGLAFGVLLMTMLELEGVLPMFVFGVGGTLAGVYAGVNLQRKNSE